MGRYRELRRLLLARLLGLGIGVGLGVGMGLGLGIGIESGLGLPSCARACCSRSSCSALAAFLQP